MAFELAIVKRGPAQVAVLAGREPIESDHHRREHLAHTGSIDTLHFPEQQQLSG